MSAIRLLVARLRTDHLPALLIMLLVLATAFLGASGPRLFARAADAGLRYEVSRATPVERNLQLGRITEIDAAPGEAMQRVEAVENDVEGTLPASVRGILSGSSISAESITWRVLDRPAERPGFLTFQAQGGLGDHVRMVEGRMPTGEVTRVPAPPPPPSSVPLPPGERAGPLFEVALSTTTADQLGIGIGARMDLVPDTDDPLVGAFGFPEPAAAEVVGLYEVADPNADFWVGDYGLDQPTLVPVGISVVLVYATALISPDAYPALSELTWPMRYTFRYFVDPERLDAGMLDQLATDLRRMEGQLASFATTPDPTRTTLQTGLGLLTDRFLAEHRTTEAVLVTAAIGPAAVAFVAIGVLALMAVRRRRASTLLLRGRGGSTVQIVGSHLIEALLLTAAPAAAGAWLASAAIEARATPLSPLMAGMVAVGTILVLVGATLPTSLSSLRLADRQAAKPIGASPRRLAFEALAVVLAIGGVVLLRQRGLAGGSAAGQLAGVDPFLAAVPALVGIAVGIVTVRLYPYPVRLAGLVAGGARGLVPALGLRRAERQAGSGHLPLIVLLLTVAIGTFSSTMLATIDRGQGDAAWQAVGAAHRITSDQVLPEELDPSAVSGVEAVAGAHQAEATLGIASGARVLLTALDATEYRRVTAGTPVEVTLPDEFFADATEDRPGTSGAPIPAIVSSALRRSSMTPLNVGDTFEMTLQARFATFVVADVRDSMPTLDAGRSFIVVPRHLLAAGLIDRPLGSTTLFIRAPHSSARGLQSIAAAAGSSIRVESQAGFVDTLRDRPLVEGVAGGFAIALAAALAYAALAVTIAMLMSGTARARETAHLRTLGLNRAQVVALTVLEHGPPVLVAIVAGLALGVGVGWVVLPGLGLAAFTGSASDPRLTVDLGQLAVITVALVVIVAGGMVLAAWAQRRSDPARAVRSGYE